MIPYGHQSIDQNDIKSVLAVLKSDWLTQGPAISAFEQALAQYCGAKYAVAVSNGTAALHLAYLAAGLGKNDEVITTPNTFVATSNMLLAVGAKPVFTDINLDTYNLDETTIKKYLTKKTKAIVPVHFAGHSCDMSAILRLARKHHLVVIEDACHALGGRYGKRRVGGLGSDMTVFSFHPVKSITTGEGGAILTDNPKYFQLLRLLRSHGIHKNAKNQNVMTTLGFNYRLTDIQAALGMSQLKKLDKFVSLRHQRVAWYQQELKNVAEIILPRELKYSYSSWHLFVIRTKDPRHRDNLVEFLQTKGIGTNFHYPPVYGHPYYRSNGYSKINQPKAEIYRQTAITIPLYPTLSRTEVKFIANSIKQYFNNLKKHETN